MLNINITLRDVALNIGRDFTISIDEQLPVRELINLLVRRLNWPEKDINGQPVRYAMRVERTRALVTGDEQIKACALLNGDILVLGPSFGPAPATSYQPSYPDNRASKAQALPQSQSEQQTQTPFTISPLKRG